MKWTVLACGHLGALGRAGLFLLVSVLMWRALDGDDDSDGPNDKNTIGRAFSQLQVRPATCLQAVHACVCACSGGRRRGRLLQLHCHLTFDVAAGHCCRP